MTFGDLILWHALYLLIAIAAITAGLLAGIWLDIQWCRNVFRTWDYLGAALAGGDGKHSISAYCGRAMLRPDGANLLVTIGIAIDFVFGDGHCEEAARKESLV